MYVFNQVWTQKVALAVVLQSDSRRIPPQVRLSIGIRLSRWQVLAVATVLLAVLVRIGAPPTAAGFTVEMPAWARCFGNTEAAMATLENSLSPTDGATAQAGASVELSGISSAPLSFAVATTPAQLSAPDVAGGAGTAQPPTAPGELPTYSFSSMAVTETPRTVYWQASFSEAAIPECEGSSTIATTVVRALKVVAAPTPAPPSAPSAAMPEAPACVVPELRGDSLRHAQAILKRAHCKLGSVAGESGRDRASLKVTRQHPKAGRRFAAGYAVDLTVGKHA